MSTPPPPQNSSWNLLCHYSWKCTMCSLQALPEKAWRIRSFFFIWHRIKKPSTWRIKRSMGLCRHLWPGQGKFWAWPCVFLFDLSAERILRPLYAQCGKQLLQWDHTACLIILKFLHTTFLLRGDNQVHYRKSQNMYHIIFPFFFISFTFQFVRLQFVNFFGRLNLVVGSFIICVLVH